MINRAAIDVYGQMVRNMESSLGGKDVMTGGILDQLLRQLASVHDRLAEIERRLAVDERLLVQQIEAKKKTMTIQQLKDLFGSPEENLNQLMEAVNKEFDGHLNKANVLEENKPETCPTKSSFVLKI